MLRTKKEVIEELEKRIKSGEERPEIEEIILEDEERILVRSMSAQKIGSQIFIGTRFEIWSDKDKYKKKIPTEGNYIYYTGYSGPTEEEMIALFNQK